MGTGFGRAVILLAVVTPVSVALVAGCRMPTAESANQAASEQEEPAATEPAAMEPADPAAPGAEGGPVEPGGGPGGEAELAVGDVSAVERDGRLGFLVELSGGGGAAVTVAYASEEGTATAGRDYVTVSGTLTFAGESAETREIEVLVIDDAEHEGGETLTLRLSGAEGANLTKAAATGTIVDDDEPDMDDGDGGTVEELELSSLEVTGGGAMYPAFDADIRHYALTCTNGTTLEVEATAKRTGASVTLLREDSDNNQTSIGSLNADIRVDKNDDVAIELTDTDGAATYVVHCLPADFPTLRVLTRTAAATGGLLFLALPNDYYAIVDYHGVPRFHTPTNRPRIFRPHSNGPVIDGKRVRYSMTASRSAILLDADFQQIRTVGPLGSLTMNEHDFVVGTDSFLFISYVDAIRDYSEFEEGLEESVAVRDSVISEVAFAGSDAGKEIKQWNSWDHLKVVPDCKPLVSVLSYSYLNSLQLVDGDIIASFRGCAQVVRIERSSGTWAVKWKLGGTDPPRSSDTEYLEIVNDDLGEFCGQHHATLTDAGRVLLFDNGVHCLGNRKNEAVVTRVVEYDISSGTEARLTRWYDRASGHGHSNYLGGVTVLDNGNWLIAWGTSNRHQLPAAEIATISEVDPGGTAVFQLNATANGSVQATYRVYHDYEANVSVPLDLP